MASASAEPPCRTCDEGVAAFVCPGCELAVCLRCGNRILELCELCTVEHIDVLTDKVKELESEVARLRARINELLPPISTRFAND